jgi:hypothetical protein
MLLNCVKGATSYEHLRTVDATVHDTFKDACIAMGLLLDDNEWQILPVVPKGEREDIVSASLPRSHLWQHVIILHFHINMRVMAANSEK